MNRKPTVTVLHTLPGRLRVQLSHNVRNLDRLYSLLMDHDGVERVRYTPVTRSVLVHFDDLGISRDEIVVRIGFALSLDYGAIPVRVLAQPESRVLGNLALYSGLLLTAAGASRWWSPKASATQQLQWLAGAGTAGAVFEHGWREARTRGYFDPEVLALAYLLSSFVRGNFLMASFVTWAATFGRHLVEPSSAGVELRLYELDSEPGQEPRYEIVVRPDTDAPEGERLLGMLGALVKYALLAPDGSGQLVDRLREVSQHHNQVLEGFGEKRYGISMRFE